MGCVSSKIKDNLDDGAIKGAGCIFTNYKLILAGYQPYKKRPIISGIGGSCNKGENYIDTAIREMLEEIFGFEGDLTNLLVLIKTNVVPTKQIRNGDYISIIYSFDDLLSIISILNTGFLTSKFYDIFPQNIEDILLKRKLIAGEEIQQLLLLPILHLEQGLKGGDRRPTVVAPLINTLPIADDFIKDIHILQR